MCQVHDAIEVAKRFNWEGDVVVHNPTVPNTRTVPGTKVSYSLDLRELLLSDKNSVLISTVADIADRLPGDLRKTFLSRDRGSFDLRIAAVRDFVESRIAYESRGRTPGRTWLFPDETLALGRGDCEDRAILFAALALASGISSYMIRVVLGKIRDSQTGKYFDHVWVMYKAESGKWMLIELDHYDGGAPEPEKVQIGKQYIIVPRTGPSYVPIFAFNVDHLWYVSNPMDYRPFIDYVQSRRFWRGYNPKFGYSLHKSIVTTAINAKAFEKKLTSSMKSGVSGLFWTPWGHSAADYLAKFATWVADVDITLSYNQLHHFDNGRIADAAKLMAKNFKSGSLADFAKVCHASADFYAHTSWGHFARSAGALPNDMLPCNFDMNAANPIDLSRQPISTPSYDAGSSFDLSKFSVNSNVFKGKNSRGAPLTRADAVAFWKGKLISGRFGQQGDSQGVLEMTQFADSSLPDFNMSGALPHHDEIAVDSLSRPGTHKLYTNQSDYLLQFSGRQQAAVKTVASLFTQWKPKS